MIGTFNDSAYDGLVLKIPAFFIELNELQPIIDALYSKLQECNKSMYITDHLNNLYELENIHTKREKVKNRRDVEKKQEEQRAERQRKIISGEMYELEWLKKTAPIDRSYIILDNESIQEDEYMTNKFTIKAAFVNKITPLISTFDDLKKFAKINCHSLYHNMCDANDKLIQIGIKFYTTNYNGNMGITYQRLHIKTDYTQTAKYIRYRHFPLIQFEDGCFGINKGGNRENYIRLDGYEMKGLTLIKKEAI
jgi:hypothetical protein